MQAFANAKELREFLPEPDLFTDMRAVLGQGTGNDLVVVKANPSWYDAQGKKPLLGKDGIPVRKGLMDLGVNYYATNAFPFVAANGKVKASEAKLAAPVIAEELRRVGGKKYLLLGANAAKWTPIFKRPFRLHKELLGRNLEVDGNLFRVVHAPMKLATTPSLYADFLQAVEELLDSGSKEVPQAPETEVYRNMTNAVQARKVIEAMPDVVACDTETTGLDPYTCRLLTIQLSPEPGVGYSFAWDLFTPEEWAYHLGGRKLIFQNGQYDTKVLANHGVFVRIHEDTMLMHSLLDETKGTHDMEQMAHKYLGIDKWSELINYDSMEDNDDRTLGKYGARDADITLRLADTFRPKLEGRFIHEVLHRAQNSLVRSEIRGIKVDREKAFQFQQEIEGHMHDLQVRVADTYGLENINSPPQVLAKLKEMDVPLRKVKGSWTTREDAIAPHAADFPIIRDILEYRHLNKANGTYIKNILNKSELDGRYHPEFKLAGTETGRLTESLILLIPRADELEDPDLGKQYQVRLRELFIPDEGHVLIGADYRGLEVSMSAYLTGDQQLIQDVNSGLDTHSIVTIDAFDLDIPHEPFDTLKARVQEEHSYLRELSKRGTFTWLYDGEENALMSGMKIDDRAVARRVLTALRSRYQGVAAWQDRIKEQARYSGSVTTPWGRTRRFVWHDGLDRYVHAEQEREAVNFPNQGTATDMNLFAFTQMEEQGLQTLFPMHDACYLQEREDRAETTARRAVSIMESIIDGPVPFRADVKMGYSWADL